MPNQWISYCEVELVELAYLRCPQLTITNLIFGLIFAALHGGADDSASPTYRPRSGSHIRRRGGEALSQMSTWEVGRSSKDLLCSLSSSEAFFTRSM